MDGKAKRRSIDWQAANRTSLPEFLALHRQEPSLIAKKGIALFIQSRCAGNHCHDPTNGDHSNGTPHAGSDIVKVDLYERDPLPFDFDDIAVANHHSGTALGHIRIADALCLGQLPNLLLRFLCDSKLRGSGIPVQWSD